MDPRIYHAYEPLDSTYGGARAVVEAEFEHIQRWRGRRPRAGLALSGGGIRSASFGLGALQALAHWRVLPGFDYLSTVSGGGYIGASLTYLLQQSSSAQRHDPDTAIPPLDVSRDNFPYISFPMVGAAPPSDEAAAGKGRLLRRLRQNPNYLSPGHGITAMSLVAVVVRNCLSTVLVHGAILVLLLLGLLRAHWLPTAPDGTNRVWQAAAVLAGAYLSAALLYIVATRAFGCMPEGWPYALRRGFERLTRYLLIAMLALLAIGLLPHVHAFVETWTWARLASTEAGSNPVASTFVGTLAALLGTLGNYLGSVYARKAKRPRVPASLIVDSASLVLLFGLLLVTFGGAKAALELEGAARFGAVGGLAAVLVFIGWLPDVNYLSTHRYYRDRLMETFLPDLEAVFGARGESTSKSRPGNDAMLGKMCGNGLPHHHRPSLANGPYHLLNAHVVLVSSTIPRYRGRGGDSFILSPLFTGSRATGWVSTEASPGSGLTLASAMAISGAALNPNAGPDGQGVTRQPVLSVLMGMFNIRLGYWLNNPSRHDVGFASCFGRCPNMIRPGLAESFGRQNLREDKRHVLLTDGGHFENLGLYELVRRRLEVIVVCDASEDPDSSFADLANAIEKVRADFGAIVDLSAAALEPLVPRAPAAAKDELPVAERGYLVVPIIYSRSQEAEGSADHGLLVYLKSAFFGRLTADLHGYRQAHTRFPNESTNDQFFDEKQFEAYRELGFQTVQDALRDPTLRAVFADSSGEAIPAPSVQAPATAEASPGPAADDALSIRISLTRE